MQDVGLIHKELAEMTGMKVKLGQPPEDPRLEDLLNQIAEHEAKLAELLIQIAELEAKIGMTEEEKAILARLDELIAQEQARVAEAESKVRELTEEVSKTQEQIDATKSVWALASECHGLVQSHAPPEEIYAKAEELADLVSQVFPDLFLVEQSSVVEQLRSRNMFVVTIAVAMLIRFCKNRVDVLQTNKSDLQVQLSTAQYELERANRRLWDAKAAKERAELAITRAIALRQAEVDAAKARHKLELRTLDNLKATYDTLLKEIELAKAQAIAEAARQREIVLKAAEEDRIRIAEEQRKAAEEAEAKAGESAGVEREEWLEKMRIALELAKDAEEAAIAAAKERETIATEIATKKAELALLELELEELRKQQEIAEERKKETEAEVAGLPTIPKWGWIALGIGGATATAGGIAYAIKKRKKK